MNLRGLFTTKKPDTLEIKGETITTNLIENVGKFWATVGGNQIMLDLSNVGSFSKAYQQCSPVTSIINECCKPYNNGMWTIVNKDGEPAISDFQKLLDRPNPLQSWHQFWLQHKIFKKIYGNGFIYRVKAAGFKNPISLWNLPNPYVTIIEKLEIPLFASNLSDMIERAYLAYYGKTMELNIDDLLIMKDDTINMQSMILSDSRLRSLMYPVNNIIATMKSRGVLASRNGIPLGIIASDGLDVAGSSTLSPNEKDAIIEGMKQTYGMTADQAQLYVSIASVKFVPVSIPMRDLMLFEEITDDIKQICMAYEFNFELTPYAQGTTFDNQEQAWKRLYQDVIIPESKQDAMALSNWLGLSLKGQFFKIDYDHVSVMQVDFTKANTAAKFLDEALLIEWNADLITLNEWRATRNYEPLAADGDLVRSEYVTLHPNAVLKQQLNPSPNASN